MANTLTNLIPDIYNALDVVSRELVGIIPAVTSDMTYDRAALGQNVRSPVAPAAVGSNVTPGVIPPDDGDQTIGNVTMTISKSRRWPIRWNGEQTLGINYGPGLKTLFASQVAQAMRAAVAEVSIDLVTAAVAGASRASGTAGTTPFSTQGDFTDATNALKIIKDNGAPQSDLHCIIDTSAGSKLLGLQSRYDVAGDTTMQNQGVLINKAGMAIREEAQILTPAAGSATLATVTGAQTKGTTSIAVATGASTGALNLSAGDIITFAGDTNKYVVQTPVSLGASASGTIVLNNPGLRTAVSNGAAITVLSAATRNLVFSRNAIALATRLPALPKQGDLAIDRMPVIDERSGLSFEMSVYPQYRQMQYELSLAWGVSVVKQEHLAMMLG